MASLKYCHGLIKNELSTPIYPHVTSKCFVRRKLGYQSKTQHEIMVTPFSIVGINYQVFYIKNHEYDEHRGAARYTKRRYRNINIFSRFLSVTLRPRWWAYFEFYFYHIIQLVMPGRFSVSTWGQKWMLSSRRKRAIVLLLNLI